jgi:hypothetical protein
MRKLSRRWLPHFLNDAEKAAQGKASEEMLRILQSSQIDDFDGITSSDESRFQYVLQSSRMFSRWTADVLPRARQSLGAKNAVITLSFTAKKLIVMDVLLKDVKSNHIYFVHYIFPDFKGKHEFYMSEANCGVGMDHSLCHNKSKVASKCEKHHLSRIPTRPIRQI